MNEQQPITEQQLAAAIEPLVKDGKLTCTDALAAAARLAIKPTRVGKFCNQRDIRIINCQLGCFGAHPKSR